MTRKQPEADFCTGKELFFGGTVMTVCKYRNVSERDMDHLFLEAFATDLGFAELFINEVEKQGSPFEVVSIERSKIDKGLGESDLTVIYTIDGERHALLIEDKIDAIAMPQQHERYIKRGQKGIRDGEYARFFDFILCPERYRETNDEAAKYDHWVSYESCLDYFAKQEDALSMMWAQQITQALETIKPEYKVDINEIAVDSFKKYAEYQRAHYSRLRLQNKPESNKVNGWWPHYVVGIPGMYILHKTDRNCVDLTITGAADKTDELSLVLKWLHESGHTRLLLEKTGKSASFRINTPDIKMSRPFETWNMADLDTCFEAIQELADLAGMFAVINNVMFSKKP